MNPEYDRNSGTSGRTEEQRRQPGRDAHPDPITGEPSAHPVGTGVGAAAGGLAGAAIGAVAGPVGAGIGATIGAVSGGLAGKGAAEAVNPSVEEEYWRTTYLTRPYVAPGTAFDLYAPAYQYGWEAYSVHAPAGASFERVEPTLRDSWSREPRGSSLTWDSARQAMRDAWSRLEASWGTRRDAKPSRQVESKDAGQVADMLNHLIQICKDGAMGFRLAAEKVGPAHAAMFLQFASDRDAFASELQDEVRVLGRDPKSSGDATGALHRGWINIKSALTQGEKAIIDECERGEDAAVEAYQDALQKSPPPELYAVISRQYTKVKGAHDRVSALKHSMQ
jgi:uncharacterized protein (TIGR02284 family)